VTQLCTIYECCASSKSRERRILSIEGSSRVTARSLRCAHAIRDDQRTPLREEGPARPSTRLRAGHSPFDCAQGRPFDRPCSPVDTRSKTPKKRHFVSFFLAAKTPSRFASAFRIPFSHSHIRCDQPVVWRFPRPMAPRVPSVPDPFGRCSLSIRRRRIRAGECQKNRCQRAFTWHLWRLWHVCNCHAPRVLIGPPRRGLAGYVLRAFSRRSRLRGLCRRRGLLRLVSKPLQSSNRATHTYRFMLTRKNGARFGIGARAPARCRPDERTQLDRDSTFRPGVLSFEHGEMALLSLGKSAISCQFLPSIVPISAAFCR
jgi:hypothetical protein